MENEYDKSVYTTCTRDCPDNCGVIARVKEGRVVRLDGCPEHEYTQGFLCPKAPKFVERVYSPDRQLYPLKRAQGRISDPWLRISWDEALDLLAERIRHYLDTTGNLSIMHYQRSGSWGLLKTYNKRFWNLLGGVTTNSGSLCSGAARAGQALDFGVRLGHDTSDFANSKFLILWGRNPADTSVHLLPIMKKIRDNGGQVAVVDPVRTNTVKYCDLHIQPRIGTDDALALAMAKVILAEGWQDQRYIDEHTQGFAEFRALTEAHTLAELCQSCGLEEAQVRDFARRYATTKPAAIVFGWGPNRHRRSGDFYRCVDALAALCGQIGIPGGGASHGYNTKRHVDGAVEAAGTAKYKRSIPEPRFGQGLLDSAEPPVKMLVTNGTNPANTSPNALLVAKALRQLEFVTVMDLFLNDTSEYAHLFLPVTTYLEDDGDAVISWGHNILGGVNRAIEPLGEARSDFWIYQQLAQRLGIGEQMAGDERFWIHQLLAPLEKNTSVKVDDLFQGPVRCPVAPLVTFADGKFPTASGRFEFISQLEISQRQEPDYPYVFLSPLSRGWIVAELTEAQHPDKIVIRVNSETAARSQVTAGQRVRVVSPVGDIEALVELDEGVGRDIVLMPFGTWLKWGGGPNRVTEDIVTAIGATAAFHETRVRIEAL